MIFFFFFQAGDKTGAVACFSRTSSFQARGRRLSSALASKKTSSEDVSPHTNNTTTSNLIRNEECLSLSRLERKPLSCMHVFAASEDGGAEKHQNEEKKAERTVEKRRELLLFLS